MSELKMANRIEIEDSPIADRIASSAAMIDYLIIEVRSIDPICSRYLELAYLSLSEKIK